MRHLNAKLVRVGGLALLTVVAGIVTFLVYRSDDEGAMRRNPDELAESARQVREALPDYAEREEQLIDIASEAFGPPLAASETMRSEVVPPEPDDAWRAYPRSEFSFPMRVHQPDGLSADELFRHVGLNRNDLVIPVESREELSEFVSARVDKLDHLRDFIHGQSAEEIAALASSGRARHVNYREFVAELPSDQQEHIETKKRELEARFVGQGVAAEVAKTAADRAQFVAGSSMFPFEAFAIRNDGDDFYAAALEELPLTNQAVEAYRAAVLDFSSGILEVFVREGCLYEQTREQILNRITSEL